MLFSDIVIVNVRKEKRVSIEQSQKVQFTLP